MTAENARIVEVARPHARRRARRKRTSPVVSAGASAAPGGMVTVAPRQDRAATESRCAKAVVDELDLTPAVGANLRRLRGRRGLSLERLAEASGVSRAMLGQIELHQSTPTINILWKITRALNVPFSALISQPSPGRAKVLPVARMKILPKHYIHSRSVDDDNDRGHLNFPSASAPETLLRRFQSQREARSAPQRIGKVKKCLICSGLVVKSPCEQEL